MTIARNDLPLDAVSINGSYIEDNVPGYKTLRAVGREVITKDLNAIDRITDGSVLINTRYPLRTITVYYIIKRDSLANMRASADTLKRMLNVTGATVIFNGDSSYYYVGTPALTEDITEGWNAIVGTYTINCFDPFKYSVTEYTQTASNGSFVVTYNGTYKGYPTLVTTFPKTENADGDSTTTSECGYVGFADQREHVLQFGDPTETDWASVQYPATVPIDKSFKTTNYWTQNNTAVIDGTITGSISTNSTDKYMYAGTWGSGTGWHGPTLSKIITGETPPIGKNFKFRWKQYIKATASQYGATEALLWNNNSGVRTLVGGVAIFKSTKDTKCKVYLYVGSTTSRKSYTVDCSKIGVCEMKKIDNNITFTVGGVTLSASAEIKDLIANEVTFHFMKKGTTSSLTSSRIYWAYLQRFSFSNYEDVKNIFMPGDVLTVNTQDAGVYLDDGSATIPATYLGALGNDWEDFYLTPGSNTIAVDYSSFTTEPPEFVIKYRERFL